MASRVFESRRCGVHREGEEVEDEVEEDAVVDEEDDEEESIDRIFEVDDAMDSSDWDVDKVDNVFFLSNVLAGDEGISTCKIANGSPPACFITLANINGTNSPIALPPPLQNPGIAADHKRDAKDGGGVCVASPNLGTADES